MAKNIIPVTKPYLPPQAEFQKYLNEIYQNRYLTNNGPLHRKLKSELKTYLGANNLTLTVNGHSGLDIALKGLKITGEVITTPFTFVSTTHALTLNNIKPIFCDIKPTDLTIDENKIEYLITPATTAIMPVHVYGHMCNIEKIADIAQRHHLKVIYDAAHTFGVKYKGIALANHGDVSMLSFHATKIFNTIEGGALVYSDKQLSRIFDAYKNFGIEGPETTDFIGGNAKLNEFQAAMGLANLSHISEIIAERKKLTELYRHEIAQIPGLHYFMPEKLFPYYEYNYSYFPVIIDQSYPKTRDALYDFLLKNGIYSRKYFYPLVTELGCYKDIYKDIRLPIAKEISTKILCLPLYTGLSLDTVSSICKLIKEFSEVK